MFSKLRKNSSEINVLLVLRSMLEKHKMQVKFGDGFTARLNVENVSENVRTLETIISCSSLYYNGVPAHRIKVISAV